MNDEISSIRAIQKCMEHLGLRRGDSPSYTVDAEITNSNDRAFGEISVTFNSNLHSGDGPYITFDDVIKGYGIPYNEFKPLWQKFRYSEENKKLDVSGNGYNFTLGF